MNKPITTTITVKPSDMGQFWGDATCFPTDIKISPKEIKDELDPNTADYYAYVTFTFYTDGSLAFINIDLAGLVEEPQEEQKPL